MAKTPRDFSSNQPDLFEQLVAPRLDPHAEHDLDLEWELLAALKRALAHARRQGLGRERVVDAMNAVLAESDHEITLRQLNAWTAASKEHHPFPLRMLAAFCHATGSDEPLRVVAHALGFDLVDRRDQQVLELGSIQVEKARLTRHERELRARLGGAR